MSERTISLTELYNAYVATNKELNYGKEFIERMVIRPDNAKALQRSICRRASVPVKEDFAREDFLAVVDDTNQKCELYASGPYSEELKNQGMSRYCVFSNILYGILVKLDMSDVADKLLYCNNKLEVAKDPEIETEAIVEDTTPVFGELYSCITNAEDFIENAVLSEETMKDFEDVTDRLIKVLHKARKEVGDSPNQAMEDLLTRGDTAREKLLASLDLYSETMRQSEVEEPETIQEPVSLSQTMVRTDVVEQVLQELPKLLQRGHEAAVELKQVKAELEELRKNPVIPETDEEKVALVKQILTGIDKGIALVLVRDIVNAIIAD